MHYTIKKVADRVKKTAIVSPKYTMLISNQILSLLMLLMAVSVVIYVGSVVYTIYKGFFDNNFQNVLYNAVLFIVFAKVFQVLLLYYQKQRVSIKQMMEMVILVLMVNIAFAPEVRDVWMNVALGIFTLGNLVIYIIYHDTLVEIDKK